MTYYFRIDASGKIEMCSEYPDFQPDLVPLTPPDTFVPEEMHAWRYVAGEFVYTPPEEPPKEPTTVERIAALEEQLAAAKILLGVE